MADCKSAQAFRTDYKSVLTRTFTKECYCIYLFLFAMYQWCVKNKYMAKAKTSANNEEATSEVMSLTKA